MWRRSAYLISFFGKIVFNFGYMIALNFNRFGVTGASGAALLLQFLFKILNDLWIVLNIVDNGNCFSASSAGLFSNFNSHNFIRCLFSLFPSALPSTAYIFSYDLGRYHRRSVN